jgi:hypothetical protein
MNQQRLECERLIYKIMETLDDPKKNNGDSPNVQFWIEQFAKMNDKEFKEFVCKPLSIFYQTSGLNREPSMLQINRALDVLNVPLLEEVYLPYKYKDKNGRPMKTKKCLVLYIHMKRMKQLLTKKNGLSISTSTRDFRTGLLTGVDKNGKESDREFESLAVSGLTETMKELSRPRADSMTDKSIMNQTIKSLGQVRLSDLPEDKTDSLSKNLTSVYFIGAQISSNLVNTDYMTPYTLKQKDMKINRT